MSNLTSTSAMVAECQTRVPIGLSSTFWMKKLNEAYRWISQKGNFVWDLAGQSITIPVGYVYFDLPLEADPGKPIYISGGPAGSPEIPTLIPFKAWDEATQNQYSEITTAPGAYSCWSLTTFFTAGPPPVYTYRVQLFPQEAMPTISSGAFTVQVFYHKDVSNAEYSAASNVYFPTPNSFDNLLIELAEAEARRIYGLAGWDLIQKRAESAIVNLLDSYRSTKNTLAGLVDQQKQATEKKLMAQERS